MRQPARQRRAGYSLIESMIALALLVSAVVGIMSMQGTTMRANQDAYETTIATTFARTWLERVKRDALRWQTRGTNNLPTAGANPKPYLTPTAAAANAWVLPTGEDASESAGADYHGFDVGSGGGSGGLNYYCANVNVVVAHSAPDPLSPATDADLLRVTVRVFWHRFSTAGSSVSDRTFVPLNPNCPVPDDDQLIDDPQRRIRVVYLSTLVRGTFL